MIQDIAPHRMDIAFANFREGRKCHFLFFYQGRLLTLGEETAIAFAPVDYTTPFAGRRQYLFAVDSESYFRIELENVDEYNKLNEELTKAGQAFQWAGRTFFRKAAPRHLAFAGITAMHLDGWYRQNRRCGVCGGELEPDSRERILRCPKCGNLVYPRINPAVIVAVTNGEELLLTKYRDREYKKYALVAGFVEIGETLEETVAREVMEETGLAVKNIRYYKSQPWGFADNLLMGFFCEVDGNTEIHMDREELSVARWVRRSEISVPPEDLSLTNEMICKFCIDK